MTDAVLEPAGSAGRTELLTAVARWAPPLIVDAVLALLILRAVLSAIRSPGRGAGRSKHHKPDSPT